jgi:hypothetical protein
MNKKILLYVIAGLCLFFISSSISFLAFQPRSNSPKVAPVANTPSGKTTSSKRPTIDPSIPKTEICPLNGAKFTKQEMEVWKTRRPLAVMIENSLDARPLSGLGDADIVYEAVAEGGITRFMGMYYCGAAFGDVVLAPVRSARIYYTKLVTEYDALYNHVGGAGNCDDPTVDERAKALCFIRRNKIKDMDQFGLDFKSCHRLSNRTNKEVAYEHTMACFTDQLYKTAASRDWTNVDAKGVSWDKAFVSWKFKDSVSNQGTVSNIKFQFWNNQPGYDVEWQYDAPTNSYKRVNGGEPAIDLNTDEQIMAKNVVVQLVKEIGPVDEHKHMLYEVTGTGKMLLFQDGQVVSGTWSKATPTTRTRFFDASNKEVQFSPGQIWIELVPSGNQIEYK